MSNDTEVLTDAKIARMLKSALNEPTVSADTVERLTVRFTAVEAGRQADARLADKNNPPVREEVTALAAQSVVGRLMMTRMPPKGVTNEIMVRQLTEKESFRRMTEGSLDRLAYDLRTGAFIQNFLKEAAPQIAQNPAAEIKNPEIKNPEIKNPEIKNPQKDPQVPSL